MLSVEKFIGRLRGIANFELQSRNEKKERGQLHIQMDTMCNNGVFNGGLFCLITHKL